MRIALISFYLFLFQLCSLHAALDYTMTDFDTDINTNKKLLESKISEVLKDKFKILAQKKIIQNLFDLTAKMKVESTPFISKISHVEKSQIVIGGDQTDYFGILIGQVLLSAFNSNQVVVKLPENASKQILQDLWQAILLAIPADKKSILESKVVFSDKIDLGAKVIITSEAGLIDQLKQQFLEGVDQRSQTQFQVLVGISPTIVHPSASAAQLFKLFQEVKENVISYYGQNCLGSKVFALSSKDSKVVLSRLSNLVDQLDFSTQMSSTDANYAPLKLFLDFDLLKAFREKYKHQLINPSAQLRTIDRGGEESLVRADPHFFSFSKLDSEILADFSKVKLAPFYIFFNYENEQSLKDDFLTPGLWDMFAPNAYLIGDKSSDQVRALRGFIEMQNFNTLLNTFPLLDARNLLNLPQGSYGGKTSRVMQFFPFESHWHVKSLSHPIQLARDLFSYLPASSSFGQIEVESKVDPISLSYLESIKASMFDESIRSSLTENNFNQLIDPIREERPHGLTALQKEIASIGLVRLFTSDKVPSAEEKKMMEELYGTKVIYPGELIPKRITQFKPVKVDGVLMHSPPSGMDIAAFNLVRGDINLHMGEGFFIPLIRNRVMEHHVLNAVWDGIVSPSASYEEMLSKGEISVETRNRILRAKESMRFLFENPHLLVEAKLDELEQNLIFAIESLFKDLHQRFPLGVFVKNYGEFGTGDYKIQITSFASDPKFIVLEFMQSFKDFLKTIADKAGEKGNLYSRYQDRSASAYFYPNSKFSSHIQALDKYFTQSKFVQVLVTDPNRLLFNQKLGLAKTPAGQNLEIRVDFIDGEPINTIAHFTTEYLGEEEEDAFKTLKHFFDKSKGLFRYISGGADLAKLEDGRWVIIELNVGGTSGATIPHVLPVNANKIVSKLQGHPTFLMKKLEDLYVAGPESLNTFLKSLKNKEMPKSHDSLEDLSQEEVARWIRDKYMQDFRKDISKENYLEIRNRMLVTFDHETFGDFKKVQGLVDSGIRYMQEKLGIFQVECLQSGSSCSANL